MYPQCLLYYYDTVVIARQNQQYCVAVIMSVLLKREKAKLTEVERSWNATYTWILWCTFTRTQCRFSPSLVFLLFLIVKVGLDQHRRPEKKSHCWSACGWGSASLPQSTRPVSPLWFSSHTETCMHRSLRGGRKIPQQLGIIQPTVWIEASSGGDLASPQSNPDEVLILKIHTSRIQQQTSANALFFNGSVHLLRYTF